MEKIETENIIKNDDINKPKNSLWKIIVSVVVIIIFSCFVTYLYLSSNSSLLSSKVDNSNKLCDGVKIVFFPGGNETDSFASVVHNGALAAERDLGANVEYVWSDWSSSKMVSQFIDAISKSPDAIAIMGHPGSNVLSPLVDEAERKNIIVTSLNVDLPDLRERYSSKGFGYVGQSLYNSGMLVSNGLIRKYNPKEGSEVIVFGVDPIADPSRYERTKGVVDGLKNDKLIVHEITMPLAVQKDPESSVTEKMFSDALIKYPNTKVIVTDHGALTASVPLHLKNLNKKPGEIIVAGFDLSVDTVVGIKNGYLGLVLDQQPYLEGYLPILQACLTKKYGFAGLYVDTGIGLIDKSNVGFISDLALQKIR